MPEHHPGHEPPRPEVLGLLMAIKDNPEDDTPRLILADFLDERGDPRGEFLRLAVMLSRLSPHDPSRAALEIRHNQLADQHAAKWVSPLMEGGVHRAFRRGLIHLTLPAATFRSRRWEQLSRTECFAWVEGVTLYSQSPEDQLQALQAPTMAHVSSLKLTGTGLGVALVPALLHDCPWLERLRSLSLRSHPLSVTAVKSLANEPRLAGLLILDLGGTNLGDEGGVALANSTGLNGLRVLRLDSTQMRVQGVTALLRWRTVAGLRELDLSSLPLGDDGARALAEEEHLAGLSVLGLSGCGITYQGAVALAESPYLGQLATLRLNRNPIGDIGVLALVRSPYLSGLTRLELGMFAQPLSEEVRAEYMTRFGMRSSLEGW